MSPKPDRIRRWKIHGSTIPDCLPPGTTLEVRGGLQVHPRYPGAPARPLPPFSAFAAGGAALRAGFSLPDGAQVYFFAARDEAPELPGLRSQLAGYLVVRGQGPGEEDTLGAWVAHDEDVDRPPSGG